MKVLDLFSGIGGFSLGLENAGMQTIGFCENNSFCGDLLRKRWPLVWIYDDIKALNLAQGVDVICGGFPCQPFSKAARGRNVAEDLWPEMLRVVEDVKPLYVIAENVGKAPIIKAEEDLKGLGYATWKRCISAAYCGADHKRDRWWLVAYPDNQSELPLSIDAEVAKLPELCSGVWGSEAYAGTIRVSDGVSNRMDEPRRRALGNTILPQIPEAIGRAIMSAI